MQKLNVQGKLFLGVLLGLASALPLACSDDDSNGVTTDGGSGGTAGATGGTSGSGGRAGAPQGGKSGGAGTAGMANGGSSGDSVGGGTPVAGNGAVGGEGGLGGEGGVGGGSVDMGGAGGMTEAGAGGMAGEGGAAGASSGATFADNVDATCTVQATLDCGHTDSPDEAKQSCVENYNANLADFSDCAAQYEAVVACLVAEPASSFSCVGGVNASAKQDVCVDAFDSFYGCL